MRCRVFPQTPGGFSWGESISGWLLKPKKKSWGKTLIGVYILKGYFDQRTI